jgi:hypothetical protein
MVYEFAMRVADLDLLFIPESGPVSPDHWIARSRMTNWSAKADEAAAASAPPASQANKLLRVAFIFSSLRVCRPRRS